MLPEHQEAEGPVQRGPGHSDHSDDLAFDASIVIHLVYGNTESARVAGHIQNGYATAKCKHPAWFESKDAFMGFVCKAFEQFWEEMKDGNRPKNPALPGEGLEQPADQGQGAD